MNQTESALPTDIKAHITGTIWKIKVEKDEAFEEGDTLVIIESMKMEMPIEADDDGKVLEIKCEEGQAVNEGDVLLVIEEE
jgi:acetyl-CoA carboxylase biotin carboxyl carrier protein